MQVVPVKTGHTIGLFPKKTSGRIRKVEGGKPRKCVETKSSKQDIRPSALEAVFGERSK